MSRGGFSIDRGQGWPGAIKNARKTHCPHGHPYDESMRRADGRRACRACERTYRAESRQHRRDEIREKSRERGRQRRAHQRQLRKIAGTYAPPNGEKTHCPHGHPYDAANTVVYNGRRNCRACILRRNKARTAS